MISSPSLLFDPDAMKLPEHRIPTEEFPPRPREGIHTNTNTARPALFRAAVPTLRDDTHTHGGAATPFNTIAARGVGSVFRRLVDVESTALTCPQASSAIPGTRSGLRDNVPGSRTGCPFYVDGCDAAEERVAMLPGIHAYDNGSSAGMNVSNIIAAHEAHVGGTR